MIHAPSPLTVAENVARRKAAEEDDSLAITIHDEESKEVASDHDEGSKEVASTSLFSYFIKILLLLLNFNIISDHKL